MAKKKKNKRKNSSWKDLNPFAKSNEVILSILSAVGVGATLVSIVETYKVNEWMNQASDVLDEQSKQIDKLSQTNPAKKSHPVVG